MRGTLELPLKKKLACLLVIISLSRFSSAYSADSDSYENRLITALGLFLDQNHESSETKLRSLTRDYPNSRSGYLLHADVLAARAGLAPVLAEEMEHLGKDQVSELRQQLQARWAYLNVIRFARKNLVPGPLLQLKESQRWIIYMDIPAKRLFVFEHMHGRLSEIVSFYATIGVAGFNKRLEGDQKTPVGVYTITGFIPGRQLHEKYGPGALTLNYPNEIDRLHKRTGSGIWIHGTEPGFVNRSPRASDGCLTLANDDFLILSNIVQNSSAVPVLIDNDPEWIDINEQNRRRTTIWEVIEKWHERESTLGFPSLTNFYSENYQYLSSTNTNLANKTVKTNSSHNILEIRNTQVLEYPGEDNVYVADVSLILGNKTIIDVRQYWQRNAINEWSILAQVRI